MAMAVSTMEYEACEYIYRVSALLATEAVRLRSVLIIINTIAQSARLSAGDPTKY